MIATSVGATGKIIQVAGPAVDIQFPEGARSRRFTMRFGSRAKASMCPLPSTSSSKSRSTSAKAAFARSRSSRPKVWCAE